MSSYPFKTQVVAPLVLFFAMSACDTAPPEAPVHQQVEADVPQTISEYVEFRKFEWSDFRDARYFDTETKEIRFLAFDKTALLELEKNPVNPHLVNHPAQEFLVLELIDRGAVLHDSPEGEAARQSTDIQSGRTSMVHYQNGERANLLNGDPASEWYDKQGRLLAARYASGHDGHENWANSD